MIRTFYKLSGAGNDFILLEGAVTEALVRRLCNRHTGIGADGVLALRRRPKGPRLAYRNADGSAAFCGNGSRCAAWWMFKKGWTLGRKEFSFQTNAGPLTARILGPRRAEVSMPTPEGLRLGLKVQGQTVHTVDTGVPHAVVFWRGLAKAPVRVLGRTLRFDKAFGPKGANVDFVAAKGGKLALRTYERGVEDETLACGTGVVAAAVVAHALGLIKSPVSVRVLGGDTLTVRFSPSLKDIWLEGPVEPVFEGRF